MLSKEQIKKIIPYKEPFLFVDSVEELNENKIIGFYQSHKDDYYFKGHFVDFPIMPGVLVVEAMAQLSSILLRKKINEKYKEYHFLAYEVKGIQFLKPIFPENKIELRAEILGIYPTKNAESSNKVSNNKIAHIKSYALVKEDLKCEARFSVVIISKKDFQKKYV